MLHFQFATATAIVTAVAVGCCCCCRRRRRSNVYVIKIKAMQCEQKLVHKLGGQQPHYRLTRSVWHSFNVSLSHNLVTCCTGSSDAKAVGGWLLPWVEIYV